MKYTGQSVRYVLKNLLYLFPFAIVPALFLALSTDQSAIVSVMETITSGNLKSWTFGRIFKAVSILSFASWQAIVFGLVGIIVIVPCVAMLMAFLEKHMRIGKKTFNGLWGKLNDNLVSTCGGVLLLLGVYEIWTLLLSAMLFFVSRISVAAVAYVASALIFIAFHILLLVLISTFYLWLPCMQITGFRTYEALVYSYHLMEEIKVKIIAAQVFVLLATEAIICVCALFIPYGWAFMLVVALLYAFIIMVFCVRMQIAYFDRDHVERADLTKYYQR